MGDGGSETSDEEMGFMASTNYDAFVDDTSLRTHHKLICML